MLTKSCTPYDVLGYVKSLHENGAVVNSRIMIAGAEGTARSHDSNLLQENGRHIVLSKS